MIKSFTLIAILLSSSLIANKYESKLNMIKENSKILIVELYQDGCFACDVLDSTMKSENIKKRLDKNFEIVKINVNSESHLIKEGWEWYGTPTTYFLDKDEMRLTTIHGAPLIEEFHQYLDKAIKENKDFN